MSNKAVVIKSVYDVTPLRDDEEGNVLVFYYTTNLINN